MICKNCGAKYPDTALQCSYCKTENPILAEQKKKEKLEKLSREAVEIEKLPQKIVNKSTNKLLKIAVILFCAALLVLMIIVIGTLMQKKLQYEKQKNNIQQLETLYSAGDYAGLYSYLHEHSLWSDTYLKYSQVSESYHDYQEVLEMENDSLSGRFPDIVYLLSYSQHGLVLTFEAVNDTVILGNEEVLKGIHASLCEILHNTFRLSPTEIQEIQDLENVKEETLLPYQTLITERLQKELEDVP